MRDRDFVPGLYSIEIKKHTAITPNSKSVLSAPQQLKSNELKLFNK